MTLLRATKAELYNSNNIYKNYLMQQYLNNRKTNNSSINHENTTKSNSPNYYLKGLKFQY